MQTTRRLMILGAAMLAGAAQARPLRLSAKAEASTALTPSELLAIGRGALAAQARKD